MDAQPIPGLTPATPPPLPSIARGATLTSAGSRLADDLAYAAELGLQEVRLDVPWALAQPKAGAYDGDVFEQVHAAAHAARGLGLQP